MGTSTDSKRFGDRKDGADQSTHEHELDEKGLESGVPNGLISAGSQDLHRRVGGKEIQLIAVGGAIGTCMGRF